jgi:hypothetical protein
MDSAKKRITRLVAMLAVAMLAVLSIGPIVGHAALADCHLTDGSGCTVDGKKVPQQVPPWISELQPEPRAASGSQPQIRYTTIQDRADTLDRHPVLMENSNSRNPTYQELMNFLKNDRTVQHKYDYPEYTCANFVVDLQHNAEKAGINCGYAGLNFKGKEDGHAINVFPTTDAWLVYVDLTGGKMIVSKNLKEGMKYYNMGVIDRLSIYW